MTKQIHASREYLVHGLMLLTITLAASSFPVVAAITNELPPEIIMFLRFSLAAALFAPYVLLKHGLAVPSSAHILRYVILSIPLVAFFWCMFESLRYTSILNTGALYTTVPAITAVYALFINGEAIGKTRSLGLLIGTVGALWIVFRGDLNAFLGLELNYGDVIFLIGCLFLGFYNPLIKRFYRGEPMEIMTFWVLISGSVWLFMISGQNLFHIDWSQVDQKVYTGVLYLALFSTLASFFLLQFSTVRIGATKVAAYGFLTPVFVIIISILVGMEAFEPVTTPGILLVIGSMLLIQMETKKTKAVECSEQ